MINSIATPVIVGLTIKGDIFFPNGLVDSIFILTFTNAFLSPFFVIIDPLYFWAKYQQNKKSKASNFILIQLTNYFKLKKITMISMKDFSFN